RGRADDRGAADLRQRKLELGQPVGGIDGDQDEAGFRRGELRQGPFRPVQRPDADALAAREAKGEEARRQRVDLFRKLLPGPAHAVAWRDQRLALAPSFHGEIEAASDGVAEQRRAGRAAYITVRSLTQGSAPPCNLSHLVVPGSPCGRPGMTDQAWMPGTRPGITKVRMLYPITGTAGVPSQLTPPSG